jgi:DNA modification methylase
MKQFTTTHKLFLGKSQDLSKIPDSSVQLVVTSPPYPMIEMWDDIMSQQNPQINGALQDYNGNLAFELMHKELDLVWNEVKRVLIPGGIACVNIGDATLITLAFFHISFLMVSSIYLTLYGGNRPMHQINLWALECCQQVHMLH